LKFFNFVLFVQTDSSREKSLELLIQSRVAKELKQLEEHESRRLREIEEQISALAASPSSSALVPTDNKVDEAAVAAAVAAAEVGAYQGHDGARLQERLQAADRLGRESVQREVEALRQRLAQRKAVRQLDQSVEKARRDVVECLRVNDRRPLDCWREVDAFKREVARLEETFVSKAL
jgi:altered-inheritance-of-mitochondria protein 13